MTNTLQIQLALPKPAEAIFRAWTDDLASWFSEFADVSVAERRYDFWGRYTPEAPDREQGRHSLMDVEENSRLKYAWRILERDTTVSIRLERRGEETVVLVSQDNVPRSHDIGSYTFEDFWFLSLENLRRQLDGKQPVRCDFSRPMRGDIQHTVEIDGTREAVFETLIRPEQLERWIANHATIEPVVGGRYDFGWDSAGPVKILELIPNERLAYSWPEAGVDTVVTWTLEDSGGRTRLTLVHSGFAPDQDTGGLNAGWLNFASWVKSIVEYGPDWKPAIIPLTPEQRPFYPKSIRDGQSNLLVEQTSIKLGNYVEVLMSVQDLSAVRVFYEMLGYAQVDENVYTDGGINIRLSTDNFPSPTLHYAGSDLARIKAAGIELDANDSFSDPNGLRVSLSAEGRSASGPQGDPMRRNPISRCGKFGEVAVPCDDLTASLRFWEKRGFTRIHGGTEPYPYAIMSDGLMIVGLHQTPDFHNPTITYFAVDMAERIEQLQRDGITMMVLEPQVNGRAVNATMRSPDGQAFFLFEGQI